MQLTSQEAPSPAIPMQSPRQAHREGRGRGWLPGGAEPVLQGRPSISPSFVTAEESAAACWPWGGPEVPESGNANCLRIYTLYHTWELLDADVRQIPEELRTAATSLPKKFLTTGNHSKASGTRRPSPRPPYPQLAALCEAGVPFSQSLFQAFLSCKPGLEIQTHIRPGESTSS